MNKSISTLTLFFETLATSRTALTFLFLTTASVTFALSVFSGDDERAALLNSLMMVAVVAFIIHYLYLQLKLSQQKKVVHNAQLDSLQAHIRPHFLFNSMNIIASLIQVNPAKAEQAVEDLSDLFRSSLQENNSVTSLDQEIHLSKSYLRIEQNRLGHRLQTVWHMGPLPKGLKIPAFTIQPLVENAVYHGIQPLEQGGLVEISISVSQNKVQISVENPMPLTGVISRGNQIALKNIRSRLTMLYGNEASLTTDTQEQPDNKRFIAKVVYPQRFE